MNVGSDKYHSVGTTCTYKGGKVPFIFGFYNVGGISGNILANILRNLYVEEHRGLGGNIISMLDIGAFEGLIY